MNFLIWIVLGAIAGWVASLVMKTDSQQGLLMDIVFGVVGAVVAGWFATMLGQSPVTGFNLYSILIAIIGASFLIGAVNFIQRRT